MASERQTGAPLVNGQENDALSERAKGLLHWQPGERKAAKSGYNRRVRRAGKAIGGDSTPPSAEA